MNAIGGLVAFDPALLGLASARRGDQAGVSETHSELDQATATREDLRAAKSFPFASPTFAALLDLQAGTSPFGGPEADAARSAETEADVTEPNEGGEASDQNGELEASEDAGASDVATTQSTSDGVDGDMDGSEEAGDGAKEGVGQVADEGPSSVALDRLA